MQEDIFYVTFYVFQETFLEEFLFHNFLFLAMCLAFFPPSPGFQTYLLGYIQRHLEVGAAGTGGNTDTFEGQRWSIHAQISHYAGR